LAYRRESLKHLQVVGSRAGWSYLQRNIFRCLSSAFCFQFSYYDRPCSDSINMHKLSFLQWQYVRLVLMKYPVLLSALSPTLMIKYCWVICILFKRKLGWCSKYAKINFIIVIISILPNVIFAFHHPLYTALLHSSGCISEGLPPKLCILFTLSFLIQK
jgi:hypothetical protein